MKHALRTPIRPRIQFPDRRSQIPDRLETTPFQGTAAVDREILQALERSRPILTPTEKNWLESGKILARIQADRGFEPRKLRDLHFDVLIAPTARSHGAKLITSNRADFELLREYRDFELEVW